MTRIRLRDVASTVNGSAMTDADKNALMSQLVDAAAREPLPDTWIYRIVVIAIGLAIFVPLLAMAFGGDLAGRKELAQLLLPIGTTALGALAGLLAPSPGTSG